jgi:hypothetical protein
MLESGYKILYPAYGTYVGSEALGGVPVVGPLAGAIGAIPGHIVGRIKASRVRARYPESFPDEKDEVDSDHKEGAQVAEPIESRLPAQ